MFYLDGLLLLLLYLCLAIDLRLLLTGHHHESRVTSHDNNKLNFVTFLSPNSLEANGVFAFELVLVLVSLSSGPRLLRLFPSSANLAAWSPLATSLVALGLMEGRTLHNTRATRWLNANQVVDGDGTERGRLPSVLELLISELFHYHRRLPVEVVALLENSSQSLHVFSPGLVCVSAVQSPSKSRKQNNISSRRASSKSSKRELSP